MTQGEALAIESNDANVTAKKCCNSFRFADVGMAKGYNLLGIGRGPIIMSNIFLSTALIRLAAEEAGCFVPDDDGTETPDCDYKIYGYKPSSLVTNIAVVSGLLSAFFMPITGAIVDYTPHRRSLGIIASVISMTIQAVQVGTVSSTWFAMAILQAINGCLYQVMVLVTYAYLPDISGIVGQVLMTDFTSLWIITQFGASLAFLVLVSAIGVFAGLNSFSLARLSQALNVLCSGSLFFFGWKLLPSIPNLHQLEAGKSLIGAGFVQIWKTSKGIKTHYGGSVGYFFLTIIFVEAGFNAFTQVSVTYLVETLKITGGEIGIVFALVYLASFPGSLLGAFVTKKTNPVISWKIDILIFIVSTITGAVVLDRPERSHLVYIWSILWGGGIGWHYSTENLIFSMCLPKGQESELTGFYVYCTQILGWLPPLIFTLINESEIGMQWALLSLIIFFFISLVMLQLMDPWDEVVEAAKNNKMIIIPELHLTQETDKANPD